MILIELKNSIPYIIRDLNTRYCTSNEQAQRIFMAIRLGYNSLEGYVLPSTDEIGAFKYDLINAFTNLNAYGKELTPEELLELDEELRKQLNAYADALKERYNLTEPNIRHPKKMTSNRQLNSHPRDVCGSSVSSIPPLTFYNFGSDNRQYNYSNSGRNNGRRSEEDEKPSVFAIIGAILALTAILSGGLMSGLYAIKKGYKSAKNVMENTKVARSVSRLVAITAGTYVGFLTGTIAGASLGSTIPGIGNMLGALIGGVFSAGLGGAFGAVTAKYLAKAISWMRHADGETNPEKWTLSEKDDESLRAQGFNRTSIDTQMKPLLKGIKAKKQASNVKPRDKQALNHLVKMLKRGDVQGAFEIDDTVYDVDKPKTLVTQNRNLYFSELQHYPAPPEPPPYSIVGVDRNMR